MKKLLYVFLAMTVAFAMVACGGGGGGGGTTYYTVTFDPETYGTAPAPITVADGQAIGTLPGQGDLTRAGYLFDGWTVDGDEIDETYVVTGNVTAKVAWFATTQGKVKVKYGNGTPSVEIAIELGTDSWADIKDDTAFVPEPTREGFVFLGWYDNAGTRLVSQSTPFATAIIVSARWTTLDLDTTDALEKTWLGNTQFPVYAFDVTGKDVKKITAIKASFKLDALTIEKGGLRPLRAMGPYFYSATSLAYDNDLYFGDFAIDANGAYAAKFNSSASAVISDYNKFHPYLLSNIDLGGDMGKLAGANYAVSPTVDGTKPEHDTWFNVTIPTSGYGWNGGTNSVTRNITDREAAGVTILNSETDFNNVYFGIGLANSANADDAQKGWTAKVDTDGMTALVKDVQIIFDDGTTVTGTLPSFPAYDVTWNKGKTPAGENVVTAKPGKTTSQVFASYIYAIQYNWRGAPDTTVVPPKDPTYTPPEPAPPIVAATGDLVIVDPADTATWLKNTTAFSGNYNESEDLAIEIPFPTGGVDLRSYDSYTVELTAYSGDPGANFDQNKIAWLTSTQLEALEGSPAYNGFASLRFRGAAPTVGDDAGKKWKATQIGGSVWNAGEQTIEADFPTAVVDVGHTVKILAINNTKYNEEPFVGTGKTLQYIVVTNITFHGGPIVETEISDPLITAYGNDKKKDGVTPGCFSITAQKAYADYGAGDFDNGGVGDMGGAGFWVSLPGNWSRYTDIVIEYTADVDADVSGSRSQIIIKQGRSSWTTGNIPSYGSYKGIENGTGKTWTVPTTAFARTNMTPPGISFQVNNNDGTNVPQKWNLTITKITLIP